MRDTEWLLDERDGVVWVTERCVKRMNKTTAPLRRAVTLAMLGLVGALYTTSVHAWQADNGDGTYSNPVLYADYPDPDIIRVGTNFYYATTTFVNSPGLTVLRSQDMVNWEIISHAVDTLTGRSEFDMPGGSTAYRLGVFAPSLRYYDGTFYIAVTPNGQNTRIYRTTDPAGTWTMNDLGVGAFDPGLFFDDDGTPYIVSSGGWDGTVTLLTLNSTLTTVTASQVIRDPATDSDAANLEGCKLLKRGSFYYLFQARPAQYLSCSRTPSLTSPTWESRIMLSAGNGGHQGAIVDINDGDDWYLFVMQDRGAIGRMPNVAPVFWEDDWPIVGTPSNRDVVAATYPKPIAGQPLAQPSTTDDFSSPVLGLQWQWNHNPDNSKWSLTDRPGHLRLGATTASEFWTARNTLTQKGQGPLSSGVVKLDLTNLQTGDVCGFGTLGKISAHIYATRESGGNITLGMKVRNDTVSGETRATGVPFAGTTLYLRTDMDFTTNLGTCSYSTDGVIWANLGGDFPLMFDWATGTFQGEQYAMFCYNPSSSTGFADVDSFTFSETFDPISPQRRRPVLNAARTTFVADNGRLLRGPYESTEWTSAAPESEIAKIKDLGFNTVHLYAEVFDLDYPTPPGNTPGYAVAEVDKMVQRTRDLGLYLVMTIGNGANNGNHNYQYAVDFWNFYADRYADETHVIFEIHNEPMAWGPSYLTGTTPPNTMAMEIAAYNAIRTHAPDTPVLLMSYAVLGGGGGASAALSDIQYFNQQVFGNPNTVWTNEAVGFHGYAGWEGTSEAVADLIAAGYPCMMTEFAASDWGSQAGGIDVEMVSELERLGVSWNCFQYIPPSGVSDDVTDPAAYSARIERAGLSWTPDYGVWPDQRNPYGNGGQPRETSGLSGTLRIQAEDFDEGGEGVAYHDTGSGNNGGAYRTTEDVDITATSDTGGGYKVGWTVDGEWLEYTIWVTEPGLYNLRLRYATPNSDASVRVVCNDTDVTGAFPMPVTGGYTTWFTATREVFLDWGRQKLRLEIDSGDVDFNWIELSPVSTGPLANGAYKIVNRNSGQVAEADTGSNLVTQNADAGTSVQRWNLVHRGAGQYSIGSAASSSRYWSTFYNGNGDGIDLNAWGFDGAADRRFILRPTESGHYAILVVDGGRSAEVAGASTSTGADIQQWEYFGGSHQQWAVVDPAAPGIPAGLSATGITAARIDLSWDSVGGATSYTVKRASSSGGPFTPLQAGLTGTIFSDTSVVLGSNYYYVVSAFAGAVEGPNSAEAYATPFGVVEGAPSPIAEQLFNVNFAGASNDGTFPVSDGLVMAAPSTGGANLWNNIVAPGAPWDNPGTVTLADANAANTDTVSFNIGGGSIWQGNPATWAAYYSEFNAMINTAPWPSYMGDSGTAWVRYSGLDTGATYDVYVYFTWNRDDNSYTYTLTEGTADQTSHTLDSDRAMIVANPASYVEGTSYVVFADVTPSGSGTIQISTGNYSALQLVKRPAVVMAPDAPAGLGAVAVSAEQVDLSWTASANADSYRVMRSTTSGVPYETVISNVVAVGYSDTNGLSAGTRYYYVVSAVNVGGESGFSSETNAVPSSAIVPGEYFIANYSVNHGTTMTMTVSNSVPGHDYRLWSTEDLLVPNWQPAGVGQAGSGSNLEFNVPIDGVETNQFFKLDVQRQ